MHGLQDILRRELERADPRLAGEELNALLVEVVKEGGKHIADILVERQTPMLIDHASIRAGFEIRLRDPWGPALDALYSVYVVAVESGEEHYQETASAATSQRDALWEALVRLHARGCHVLSEIHALLRTGHSEGAAARWRTLHELAVIAQFLAGRDQDVAQRFLEHQAITDWWAYQEVTLHADIYKHGKSPEELEALDRERDRLLQKYGPKYDQPWGWLDGIVEPPRFAALEKAADLSHWRPLARDANAALHGGASRLYDRLGVENASEILLIGPSNEGLDQPGVAASMSISMVTTPLLLHRANMDSMVSAQVVIEMTSLAADAFADAADRYTELAAEDEKAEAKRARRRERYRARKALLVPGRG